VFFGFVGNVRRRNGRLDFVKHQAKKILASLSVAAGIDGQGTSTNFVEGEPQDTTIDEPQTSVSMRVVSRIKEDDAENDWNMQINSDDETFESVDNTADRSMLSACHNNIPSKNGVRVKTESESGHGTIDTFSIVRRSSIKPDVLRNTRKDTVIMLNWISFSKIIHCDTNI